ncbi:hypothetical protein Q765_03360 [Flavobacterium rivuli WB 3.3-2 = DSM 21788]|uniref:Tyr recombinase domain-containing protein n=1 Tax=Flavobacterium rivuli WB 3.3-2 = DSM 21788 TaxID=1121895 RepID=A0A0A2MIG6_9FLAO|nr:hypothetical protein [Flavobacterium rivuli]KGO88105.1 hypothetical protein Q765_03360 [Flavobacterium rivuli WB 3.3-2 = DSM 21788]
MKKTQLGCSYSELWVSPSDWKTTKSKVSLKQEWYVQCYYYDPAFHDKYPKGKPIRQKLNKWKTLEDRRAAAEIMLKEYPVLLEKGFNPITKKYMIPAFNPDVTKIKVLDKDLLCTEAIEIAWNNILEAVSDEVENPFEDVKIAKNRFVKGLNALHFNDIKIIDIQSSHIKQVIKCCRITDGYYNKFLSYMTKIWTELYEYDCVTTVPFKLYKKKKNTSKPREILQDEDFTGVMDHLYQYHYSFYRYAMIFHNSGGRSTELMMVQKKHVDIKNQEYTVLIKKGDQYVWEIKVITVDVLHLWIEIYNKCPTQHSYLFSKGLEPGPKPIDPAQISRRWHRHIKTNYSELSGKKITSDFYALKHLFLSKLDEQKFDIVDAPENIAQLMASHRSSRMTNTVYLVNKKKQEREIMKRISIHRDPINEAI